MDLGTIRRKLEKGKYANVAACVEDVRLVWRNCMAYNADGSDFYILAETLSKRLEERYQKLVDEFGEDCLFGRPPGSAGGAPRGARALAPTAGRDTPGTAAGPPRAGAARDAAAGEVSLDDRARFAARLQRLSGVELGHVLQVIDTSCPEALEDPTDEQTRSDAVPHVPGGHHAWDEFDGGCSKHNIFPTES